MIFDWNLRSRKHRTNAHLIGAISPKKPFSSIMRYIVLWRRLWRYRINVNIKTWYPQKPHILTFTLIPSSFFSDHCVKLYRWMCITFQMPLVYYLITSVLDVCVMILWPLSLGLLLVLGLYKEYFYFTENPVMDFANQMLTTTDIPKCVT